MLRLVYRRRKEEGFRVLLIRVIYAWSAMVANEASKMDFFVEENWSNQVEFDVEMEAYEHSQMLLCAWIL